MVRWGGDGRRTVEQTQVVDIGTMRRAERPWRCRHCHNLTYSARQALPSDRHLLKAQKIREQLGGSLNMLDAFPPKPKGMHRRRYERFQRRHDAATERMTAHTFVSSGVCCAAEVSVPEAQSCPLRFGG